MTPRHRLLAAVPLLAALALAGGCDGGLQPPDNANSTMDMNMAAQADAMDAVANSRANAMAGDMMGNSNFPAPADNQAAGDNSD